MYNNLQKHYEENGLPYEEIAIGSFKPRRRDIFKRGSDTSKETLSYVISSHNSTE